MQNIEDNGKIINYIKLILIGESGTGKTSLIDVYSGKKFSLKTFSSLSSNYIIKKMEINQKNYVIKIWDTAGQERFRSLNKLFIKDSQIVIFVYDVTKKKTFEELGYWVNFVQQILPENVIFGIVANKMDLINADENNEKNNCEYVKGEEGQKYSDEIGAIFCETSAKDDIEEFADLVRQLINKCILQRNNIEKEWEIMILDKSPIKMKKNKLC